MNKNNTGIVGAVKTLKTLKSLDIACTASNLGLSKIQLKFAGKKNFIYQKETQENDHIKVCLISKMNMT